MVVMTWEVVGAFRILPARFLNRGLGIWIAIILARFLRTLLPASVLLSVCSICLAWVRLPTIPISVCLKFVMRAFFPGAVTMPMKDCMLALHFEA